MEQYRETFEGETSVMKPTILVNNNIKYLRAKAGFSQKELAEKVGCSRESIQKIEKNNMIPSLELAHNIAVSLGVNEEEIFVFEPIQAAN